MFQFSSGAARGRTTTTAATLIALVLATLAPLVSFAQTGLPVYQDRTKAKNEPWPGDVNARAGLQNLVINPPDSLRHLAPGNDVDGAWTYLTNPEQGHIYFHPAVIQSRRSPGEVPDSSAVYAAAGATRWFGAFHFTLDADSAAAVVMALQVRGHTTDNNDSLSTHPWSVVCSRDTDDAAFGTADSIGSLKFMNQGVWDVDDVMLNERPMTLVHHGYPRAMWVPLTPTKCSDNFTADGISVRIRSLRVYKADGTVHSVAVQTVYKMDLYGYR